VFGLALDGVGGDATGTLLDIVGWDAKIVCYAAPTPEPIKVNPLGLVAKRASIHPFFMYYPELAQHSGEDSRRRGVSLSCAVGRTNM
jgi:hypothetical protein